MWSFKNTGHNHLEMLGPDKFTSAAAGENTNYHTRKREYSLILQHRVSGKAKHELSPDQDTSTTWIFFFFFPA